MRKSSLTTMIAATIAGLVVTTLLAYSSQKAVHAFQVTVPMTHCDQPPVGTHPCSICPPGSQRANQPACEASPPMLYVFGTCVGPRPANCIDGGKASCGDSVSCTLPIVIGPPCANGPQSVCKP